ncbi:hypothetical protein [Parasphingorhabdus pacifica]
MPIVQVAEQAGSGTSEDVVRVLPRAVSVLDGATSLRPTDRTGGWYAERLSEALGPRLAEDADLTRLLADSISEVAATHDLQPGSAPSSTVALLRWDDAHVEALVLADSPIVVFTGTGAHPVTDDRLANLRAPGGDGYRDRLRSGGGFDDEHWNALRDSGDATGRWRNVDGGFWVAEADPAAAFRAARARWPREAVRSVLIATDGVSCGVDDYGLYPSWAAMLDQAVSDGPQRVLDTVRAAEESDADGTRWPRPKRHDDQALALVRFANPR